ncbi:MAG TPA: type II secretion system protein GspC [bacterium]|nr:type II secretion system protein GspC [bacterium]
MKKYIWVGGLVCVVIISYFLAKITTLIIEGYFPNVAITSSSEKSSETTQLQQGTKVDVDLIISRNIFNAQETTTSSENATTETTGEDIQVSSDQAVETKLPIKLIATVSVGDGKNSFSSCVIESNKAMDTYLVGDKKTFAPNTRIISILPKRVEFMNSDQLEYVKLEEFAKAVDLTKQPTKDPSNMITKVTQSEDDPGTGDDAIVRQGNTFQISRAEIDGALTNVNKLFTDIRAVPFFEGGVAKGFKILSVKNGSLFEKLGIRRGDVLKSVNGRTLDIQSGFETFGTLKNESEFELEINRRDEDVTYKYEVI